MTNYLYLFEIMKRVEKIEIEIIIFKRKMKEDNGWDTGYNLMDYMDKQECLEYGKLLGKRDILNELKEGKNEN